MVKKKKASGTAILCGAIVAVIVISATYGGSQYSFGDITVQEVGLWLIGIFASIAAIFWIWSKKKGKEILHKSEREFLGSLTAFSTLITFIGMPVLEVFATFI